MKCDYHPDRDAVGICVNCGRPVCAECRTILGDKIYCQPCANEIFVSKPAEKPIEKAGRPGPITAASILGYVVGGFDIIGGIILLVLAPSLVDFLEEFPGELPQLTQFLHFELLITFLIVTGIISLAFGIGYVVAGNRLWKCKRSGGIIGIAFGAMNIISSILFSWIPSFTGIALIVLIALRWSKLS
jgi:hypothetical protein